MTSNKDESPQFKKITGDKKLSTFQELDKEEVEDEVFKAVKEGVEQAKRGELTDGPDLQIRQELDVILEDTNTKKEETKDAKSPIKAEDDKTQTEESKGREKATEVLVVNRGLSNALRKLDHVTKNRTCASCLERKSIDDFAKGKKSDFCWDCEGK